MDENHKLNYVRTEVIFLFSKVFIWIFSAFILSWSPYFIFNFLSVYHHIAIDSYHMRQMSVLFQTFAPINSAVNPLLFLIFNGKKYFEKCKKNNPACHTDVTHLHWEWTKTRRLMGNIYLNYVVCRSYSYNRDIPPLWNILYQIMFAFRAVWCFYAITHNSTWHADPIKSNPKIQRSTIINVTQQKRTSSLVDPGHCNYTVYRKTKKPTQSGIWLLYVSNGLEWKSWLNMDISWRERTASQTHERCAPTSNI